jgi:hypothetical protein
MAYYKISVPGADSGKPGASWATEVILERDDETREPTKVARVGEPIELNEKDRKVLKELGFEVTEAKKGDDPDVTPGVVGSDVAGAGPVFGDPAPPASVKDNDKK